MLPKSWPLPEVFRQRLGKEAGHQRLMIEEGHLLAILHQVPDARHPGKREPAFFWVDDAQNWKSTPSSGGRSALKQLVDDYASRIESLHAELDATTSPATIHCILEQATPLHRSIRNLARVTQQLREQLPDDRKTLAIRDAAGSAERSAELLAADARSTLDYLTAQAAAIQAEEATKMAREAKTLNRLLAFFFPLATLAALFGMNPPGEILARQSTHLVIIASIALGAMTFAIIRKK